MATTVDADQHLFESRTLWTDHAEPSKRDLALRIADDPVGNAWLEWRGRRIGLADVPEPGRTALVGERLVRARAGEAPAASYDELLPRDFWDPAARLGRLDAMGVDESVLFPQYGLLWERIVGEDLEATRVNMGAWNRWAAIVAGEGGGRLHPVAHMTLRDLDWLDDQLAAASAAGIGLAKIAPGLVDGRPLSHPDLDRAWSAFEHHGVSPVFHVADTVRPFADAWYADDPDASTPVLTSVFLWVPAALALTDLVVHGVLDRHPDLRIGVFELSAVWLPMFLMYLDGGIDFSAKLVGESVVPLRLRPSEYVRRQVRLGAFAYEQPARLAREVGDLFMAGSDWPHSEGTADPLADYRGAGTDPASAPALFAGNVGWLLHRG